MEKSNNQPQPIILVDDDREILDLLATFLSTKGFKTFCFSSGEEAVKEIKKIQPVIAVVDIIMHGLDGAATLKLFKKEMGEKFPVIICSSTNLKMGGFINPKFIRYVEKPVDLEKFHQNIQSLLTSHEEFGLADQ